MPTWIKAINVHKVKMKLGIVPKGPVQQFLTKKCAEHMDKYVPYDEGDLAYTNRWIGRNYVLYQSPYAHYMYVGKVMGPNIPFFEEGIITWRSPKKKPKHYTGKDINYSKSQDRGHKYAGPYWDKRMWSAEKKEIMKEVRQYMKNGGK